MVWVCLWGYRSGAGLIGGRRLYLCRNAAVVYSVFASGQSGQAWGLRRPAWAFLGAGRAGLWASVRLSGPIWPDCRYLQAFE